MKNTLSRIEEIINEPVVREKYGKCPHCSFKTKSHILGSNAIAKHIKHDHPEIPEKIEKIRHQILDLIKGIKAEMKKKNKHDDINGVWTEANHNKLVDCSYREAECYNSAIKDVTAILDNYKKEIQK